MKKWYCVINGQTFGPYSKDQLRVKAERGTITPDTPVRTGLEKGGRNWVRAGETEINDIFSRYIPASDNSRKSANSGGRVEENKDDVKNTIILKILQMFKDPKFRSDFIAFMILGWPLILLLLPLAVVLIVIYTLYRITEMILRHRRLKRQQDIDILNADVNKMSDDEAARLAEKYQNK
jgi:hypothetical protein